MLSPLRCSPKEEMTDNSRDESAQTEVAEITGQFWNVETPDVASAGKAVCRSWTSPVLHLNDEIVVQRTTQTAGAATRISGDPDDIVDDFRPLTIFGINTAGEKLSILGAQGGARDFGARQ
jgi:hypothetical protein